MEQYVIKGGNPLVGEVEIAGAKNAALAILSAAIMTDETILIENLPDVRDINAVSYTHLDVYKRQPRRIWILSKTVRESDEDSWTRSFVSWINYTSQILPDTICLLYTSEIDDRITGRFSVIQRQLYTSHLIAVSYTHLEGNIWMSVL